ncbi:glutaredoxin family protein [Anaerobacillus sp. MEB173]|uniref:glutaredoxin family protein n=1 Tax=Anaerobacillus sp. MEB173 TaxID=3383345 RepID=UPI003F8E1781
MNKKVTVYSKDGCYYCVMVKKYLDKHGIDYNVIDVSKHLEEKEKMIEATGNKGVPQLKIGEEWVVGFNARKIWEKLDG